MMMIAMMMITGGVLHTVLSASHVLTYLTPTKLYEEFTIIIPTLWMWKLKRVEVEHTWQSWDLSSCSTHFPKSPLQFSSRCVSGDVRKG